MTDAVRWAKAIRAIDPTVREEGLTMPAFRSPPKDPSVNRAIERRASGYPVVYVRIRGRADHAVAHDCVVGVFRSNDRAPGDDAVLYQALVDLLLEALS